MKNKRLFFKNFERMYKMLIAICGIDGAGKTTQINMLATYMKQKAHKRIHITKQPTEFYRKYDRFRQYVNKEITDCQKELLYELALLSATDKMRHYQIEIMPNIDDIIICDRYVFSAFSYFMARGIDDIEWLKSINKFLPTPDVTIYLDITPQSAYERILKRDGGYTKKEETDIMLLSCVRNNFVSQPWGIEPNYHILKTESLSELEVHTQIVSIIDKYM